MTTPTMDLTKKCSSCPAFLQADKAPSKFKKSIGAPICGRFGTVLGKPGMSTTQAEKLQTHVANNCGSYGQPLPPVPVENRFVVTMPDIDLIGHVPDPALKEACRSCAMCKNFVRDDVVMSELGWTTGLCAATGRLILPNRQVMEARNCEVREYGTVRTSTAGLHVLPEYEDAFQLNANPVKAYFESKKNFIEPHEWPTEKDVTDTDKAAGIKSWRKIVDPAGSGNFGFLPVYDPDHFDEAERAKIPRTGDDEHPELYVDHFGGVYLAAIAWNELDETPAVWGEAGTGKTELFRHLAWLMCLPFERISITASTELDDIAGKMHYSPDKGTYFTYGRLPLAWTKPCVICLDEPNVGQSFVWQWIRPLTDNSKQMVLDMNNNEHLKRHDDCYLGMAMNASWDARNVGTQEIGDADVNRLFHVYVELPPAALEREIIRNRVKLDGWEIDDSRLDTIMGIADEIRGLCKEGTLPITWALRPQIKVARASRWFDLVTAYRRAVADYLEPEAQAALLDVVRAHAESL